MAKKIELKYSLDDVTLDDSETEPTPLDKELIFLDKEITLLKRIRDAYVSMMEKYGDKISFQIFVGHRYIITEEEPGSLEPALREFIEVAGLPSNVLSNIKLARRVLGEYDKGLKRDPLFGFLDYKVVDLKG